MIFETKTKDKNKTALRSLERWRCQTQVDWQLYLYLFCLGIILFAIRMFLLVLHIILFLYISMYYLAIQLSSCKSVF